MTLHWIHDYISKLYVFPKDCPWKRLRIQLTFWIGGKPLRDIIVLTEIRQYIIDSTVVEAGNLIRDAMIKHQAKKQAK